MPFSLFPGNAPFFLRSSAKKLYGKFETNIPRNKTARPLFQFLHSCMSSKIGRPVLGIYITHRYMNVGSGNEASQIHFWAFINRIFFAVRYANRAQVNETNQHILICEKYETLSPFCLEKVGFCLLIHEHR